MTRRLTKLPEMSTLNNVMRLLDATLENYPNHLPRSKLEVIQLLGGFKSQEEVLLVHMIGMEKVHDKEIRELCDAVAAALIHVTSLAEDLVQWASGNSTLLVPSAKVHEALQYIYCVFERFKHLADKPESRPKLSTSDCLAYFKGCFNYSITFQRLLYPEDDCEHLDFYSESLEADFESTFEFDIDEDYKFPNSNHIPMIQLADCIPPVDQIPIFSQLRPQPGKPVIPQMVRNPQPYGPALLPNINHPSNRAYFENKHAKAEQDEAGSVGVRSPPIISARKRSHS